MPPVQSAGLGVPQLSPPWPVPPWPLGAGAVGSRAALRTLEERSCLSELVVVGSSR